MLRAATKVVRTTDRGVEGWLRAVELRPEDLDELKIGSELYVNSLRYRIAGLSKRIKPYKEDGAVVLIKIVSDA